MAGSESPRTFAIGSFEADGRTFPGLVIGERVFDVGAALPGISSTRDLLMDWGRSLDLLAALVADPDALGQLPGHAFGDVRARPPVQPPGPIIAAGANYREHILQMSVAHRLGRSNATDEELWAEAAAENDERRRSGDPYV